MTKFLIICSLLVYGPRALAAMIVGVDTNNGIIYADLHPTERSEFAKGDRVIFYLLPEHSKYSGKIVDVIQERRLVIDVEGGAYYMRMGSGIELRRKQSLKRIGRKLALINRSDEIYRNRRNPSIFGGAAMANGKISADKAFLLYGGGLGVSLPWNTELEGHYWLGSASDVKFKADMSVIAVHVKKFFSNALFAFGGIGYRSVDVALIVKKSTAKVPDGTGEPPADPDVAVNPESAGPSTHFSKDIVVELGVGARVQIPTYIIGKSMIFGIDLGAWYLASVLDSTTEINLELDYEFPLPISTIFGRVYGGFSF